uniref:Uncharacterized protein n=1 Tax=Cairina moschata TaxID=8855 RepID=A0A8C3BRD2_CAIMO
FFVYSGLHLTGRKNICEIYYPTLLKMNIDKRLLHKRESTAISVANGCQCKQLLSH